MRKRVIFVDGSPSGLGIGHWVDFSQSSVNKFDRKGQPFPSDPVPLELFDVDPETKVRWRDQFIDWLGDLNGRNACVDWWAYTTTAKNVLTSQLGNQYFQTQGLLRSLTQGNYSTLYVNGATHAQIEVIRDWVGDRRDIGIEVVNSFRRRKFLRLQAISRLLVQAFKALVASISPDFGVALPKQVDVLLFTYVDAKLNDDTDRYFGSLPKLMDSKVPGTRAAYAAYISAPHREAMRQMATVRGPKYFPLFRELQFSDFVWALVKSLRAINISRFHLRTASDAQFVPLLRDALLSDLSFGGYFHNLLLYRAIPRLLAKTKPSTFVYPYENKSLEKLMLLAIRKHSPGTKIIGYQHTAITPRHTTLLFAPNEASHTPLPDRIVTVGEITRDYLAKSGNYPEGIFETGYAIRQTWREAVPRAELEGRPPRILLALSSSRQELVGAVAYFIVLRARGVRFELGIRPHINFPISILSDEYRQWIASNAHDFSNTALVDDINWCDLTAYVSSTVSLESLMVGKPIIYIASVGVLSPDPILGELAMCWRVLDVDGFIAALAEITALPENRYSQMALEALAYVRKYLAPPREQCVELFMGAKSYG